MKNSYLNSGEQLLDAIAGRKVLVVGDIMIDEYIWGDVSRMSPEAPVPIVDVQKETLRLGGAANVANNIVSLRGEVELCGLVGDDQMGRWLVKELEKKRIGRRGISLTRERPTTMKTRVIAHSQQVVRVDREMTTPMSREEESTMLSSVKSFLSDSGAVIISDYSKGVITPTLTKEVIRFANEAGVPVAVDPKIQHFPTYRGVTVLTPNLLEAAAGANMVINSIEALMEAGWRIIANMDCRYLLITRGDQGMTLFKKGGEWTHIPAVGQEVYDVTGAGDTVVATLALAMAAELEMDQCAWLANVAAGVVVGEVGTMPITTEKMRARFRELSALER